MSFDLETLRPFLKGIKEAVIYETGKVFAPTKSIEFFPHKEGYLLDISGVVDTPFANIHQNLFGQDISSYIYLMYLSVGLTTPNNAASFVSKYDAIYGYTMCYFPRPYKYYNKNSYIKVVAPDINPITGLPIITNMTVIAFLVHYIEIDDKDAFEKSLKEFHK